MLSPCQFLTLIPAGCAIAVVGIALYETRQQRLTTAESTIAADLNMENQTPIVKQQFTITSQNPVADSEAIIAAANAQTAKWMELNQESAEDETVIEFSPFGVDESDRSTAQALLVIRLVADWLGQEAENYGDETGQAIGQIAGRLRSMGLNVLDQGQKTEHEASE